MFLGDKPFYINFKQMISEEINSLETLLVQRKITRSEKS